MTALRIPVLAALALAASVQAFAQSGDNQCILAGRLGEAGWAPRLPGVQLLDAGGKAVTSADKQALAGVKQVRLTAPALLSRCDGNGELALGPDALGPKSQVPAVSAGVVPVESVNFPKLRRGGELVELKLTVPAERVTLVTR
jgi:hypothetical protein